MNVRILIALGSALLVAAVPAIAVSPAASAESLAPPPVTRLQGVDRYDQAVQVSKNVFGHVKTVYIASGERFPDALSAASVAGLHRAPLLLTPYGGPTAGTIAELNRLDPDDVVIVGGPAAVSEDAARALETALPDAAITRIGGADRFEVSRALIQNAAFGVSASSKIYIASGLNFPDALAASPAAIAIGAPVLLVNGAESELTSVENGVLDDLEVSSIRIAGGASAVSAALETSLGQRFTVTRAGGTDRFEAAVALNHEAFSAAAGVVLASGLSFPDALSVGPAAGMFGSPVYLVQKTCVPKSVLREIDRLHPVGIAIVGGPAALSSDVDALKPC